jgi:phenylpropionate dioxygenase-like ring-hydroxylating dioxygenase large terminal subunit
MQHPRLVSVVRAAIATAQLPEPPLSDEHGTIPVAHYTDPARIAAERARLFRALPIPIAHVSEVLAPRSVVVRELDGVSIILARSEDGVLHGMLNACRHRGVRLVREPSSCPKALVCPYHNWTYGLDGALRHVPHACAFEATETAGRDLVPVRIEERHGIVWASLSPNAPSVAEHLGELDEEITLERDVALRRQVSEQRGNWKFLMEAFLEGYHIRSLHRSTVYPFFVDARSAAERVGPHVRAATARRTAREANEADAPLRELTTPSYMIFPATTLILHPDWTSLVVVQPLATDRFLWSHTQLVHEDDVPKTDAAIAHFERSFSLIEGSVFSGEDLLMCAEIQNGIETGANESFLFGRLESPALWFHESIRAALQS